MAVAVIGSRTYPDAKRRVYSRLRILNEDWPTRDLHIVSGGAVGVDQAAAAAAKRLGLGITVFDPDWDGMGRRAGLLRNELIVDAADRVIAFWDFRSRGTLHTIRIALQAGKPVEVWDEHNQPAGPRAAEAVRGR